jgi:hypothetical protein
VIIVFMPSGPMPFEDADHWEVTGDAGMEILTVFGPGKPESAGRVTTRTPRFLGQFAPGGWLGVRHVPESDLEKMEAAARMRSLKVT